MRDLRQYWQEIRDIERGLGEFEWIMSLDDPRRGMVGGRIAQANAAQAAQRLHAKTHRMATEEEISAHLAKEDEARRQSFQSELRKRGVAVVAVPTSAPPEIAGKRAAPKQR